MNKYILTFGLLLPATAFGYGRIGDVYELPPGCGSKAQTAIRSVYPNVDISVVQSWECRKTWQNAAAPNASACVGVYLLTVPSAVWREKVDSEGLRAWMPVLVNRETDTITVRRSTPEVVLNTAQRQAHAPLFIESTPGANDACIRGDSAALNWTDFLRFRFWRGKTKVLVQSDYVDSAESDGQLAEEAARGKVSWVVEPQ